MEGNMIKEIERIIHGGMAVDIDGTKFSALALHPVQDHSAIDKIVLSTLTGLKDYICENLDDLEKKKMFIVVKGHDSLRLLLCADRKTKIRQNPVSVELDRSGKCFPFGNFIPAEDFIINMGSLFEETDDLSVILKYISKLAVSNSIQAEDDGVSQTAIVKKSVSGALVESKVAPSKVLLKPRRTFIEIDQPESTFVFRMKSNGDSLPLCAIFEADGGAWKVKAAQKIKEWLTENVKDVKVIA